MSIQIQQSRWGAVKLLLTCSVTESTCLLDMANTQYSTYGHVVPKMRYGHCYLKLREKIYTTGLNQWCRKMHQLLLKVDTICFVHRNGQTMTHSVNRKEAHSSPRFSYETNKTFKKHLWKLCETKSFVFQYLLLLHSVLLVALLCWAERWQIHVMSSNWCRSNTNATYLSCLFPLS